ncbi:MAG: bifunctional phosphopantothenoylcysteine decarboxylase/phosphopantothenate--cysteine ligase CoaBC [SAR86 cluster bacterium]|nr:bifunctional phosphopantothenoylcysteine decarboxylase/phosphopantothenate--cysteine ligase CoaBC [SAR86 cluster bacterium]
MIRHPSLDIVESYGTELTGKKIVLCVAGSVAAYKSIELARLLMRHGGNVKCVMSNASTKLIKPDYMKWATGNNVITKLTGNMEHIDLADYKRSDLVIVYPSTANTLGKLATGIDDTPISTILTVAFGSKIPIVMGLAMHRSMYENAAVRKNIAFLEKKVDFVSPNMIEGKAKAPEPEDVLHFILTKFGQSKILKGKKVLMTAGPTIEKIDPIRVITNHSSGKTGVLLASELVSAGAKVTLVYGPGIAEPPKGAKIIHVETVTEMFREVKKQMAKKFDVVILAAAASDYIPKNQYSKKIKSTKNSLTVELKKAPKIIDHIKKLQKDVFLIGFKAETDISKKELVIRAKQKLRDSKADMIIANDIGKKYFKDTTYNELVIVDSKTVVIIGRNKKERISRIICKNIEKRI